jgi:hypothetical protein
MNPHRRLRTPGGVAAIAVSWFILAPAGAAELIDLATAQRANSDPRVIAVDARLTRAAQSGATDSLVAELQSIAADRMLDPVARESLLDRGLHDLARLAPTPAARALASQLQLRAPQVYLRTDPDHGGTGAPLYDIGATARFVLGAWQRSAARDQAAAALQAGLPSAIERFARGSGVAELDPERSGIIDAFTVAPRAALLAQRAAMIAAFNQGERVDELGLVLARRLPDREMLDLVIGHADAPVALAAVQLVPQLLDSGAAFESLAVASRRPEIASAALLGIGKLAGQDAAARDFLLDAIQDPSTGPSAAAALGSLQDPLIAAELGRRLQLAKTESSQRMLVLALQLDGAPAARAELQRFADRRTGSPELRRELRQWLAH